MAKRTINTDSYAFSFSSITLKVDGEEYTVKEVSYNDGTEPSMVYGSHPVPLGMTRGPYKADGSCVMFREDFQALRAKLAADFYTKSFSVLVAYAEGTGTVEQDELVGCRFNKRDSSNSQGADPSIVKLDLAVMYIKWNGVDPFATMPNAGK